MIKIHKTKFVDSDRYKTGKSKGIHKWRVKQIETNRYFSNGDISDSYNFGNGYEVFRDFLITDQGAKCCYCEKPIDNGEIEHYRPKGSYQQERTGTKITPGYYFLAFIWENLLISCGECNSSGKKGILFPINTTNRARNLSELKIEEPIIINPSEDTPEDHISFNEDIPVGLTDRGVKNIDIFGLTDRGDLNSIRRDKYQLYKTQSMLLTHGLLTGQDEIEAKKVIKNAIKPKNPFSGMIRANIKKGNI